jgi:hypothetical protein
MTEIPKIVSKFWVHSHEEDTEDVRVYRPRGYKFPPSRGRGGFEIKENGEFIKYGIAPEDGSKIDIGHVKLEEPNRIKINFEDPKIQSSTLNIVSCDESILKVKK